MRLGNMGRRIFDGTRFVESHTSLAQMKHRGAFATTRPRAYFAMRSSDPADYTDVFIALIRLAGDSFVRRKRITMPAGRAKRRVTKGLYCNVCTSGCKLRPHTGTSAWAGMARTVGSAAPIDMAKEWFTNVSGIFAAPQEIMRA